MHVLTVKMVKRCELSKSLSLCHMHRISHSRHSNHSNKITHIKIQKKQAPTTLCTPTSSRLSRWLGGIPGCSVAFGQDQWLVGGYHFGVSAYPKNPSSFQPSHSSHFSLVFFLATLLENDPGYFFF